MKNIHSIILIPCLFILVSLVGCASPQYMGKLPHERGGPSVTIEKHDGGRYGGDQIRISPSLGGHSPAYNKAYRREIKNERRHQYYEAKRDQVDSCRQDAIERRQMYMWDWRFYNDCLEVYERIIIGEQERAYRQQQRRDYRKGRLDAQRDINGYFAE